MQIGKTETEEFEVEKIIDVRQLVRANKRDKRRKVKVIEYLVRWKHGKTKGWKDSWEPLHRLQGCKDLIKESKLEQSRKYNALHANVASEQQGYIQRRAVDRILDRRDGQNSSIYDFKRLIFIYKNPRVRKYQ